MRSSYLTLTLLLAACPLAAQEKEKTVSVTVETAAVSQYLWRGYVLNDSPSLQPAVTISYNGLTASSWSSFSRRVPHNQAWTEHDLTLEYAREIRQFTFSVGFLDYRFPDLTRGEGNRTYEVSAGVAHSSFFSPSFKVYRDLSLGKGWYYAGGIAHSFATKWKITLTPAITVGVNQHMYQPHTTISDADLGLTAEAPLNSHLKVSAFFMQMVGHRSLFGNHNAVGTKLSFTN